MKLIKIIDNQLNESSSAKKLSIQINRSIEKVDDSLSYIDFAKAVAYVLKDEYGAHIYEKFINVLSSELQKK